MDHISDLVNNENCQPSSWSNRPLDASRMPNAGAASGLSSRLISRIWEKMAAIYGHRWVSAYGAHADETGQLSQAAETWAQGLAGLSREQLRRGFEALLRAGLEWPPTLPEFRDMCAAAADVPDLATVVRWLANAGSREGSLVDRYRHPLALAIAQTVDMYALRTASTERAFRLVGPVYKRMVAEGWPGWPEHAHDRPKAITHDRPVNRAAALAGIAGLRSALGGLPS
jgi:hypothetical protein